MPNVRKRIEGLERSLARTPPPDPHDVIKLLALQSLSMEELTVLRDVIAEGKQECQWTECELTAVKALNCAFEREVQRAGYRSMAEFQRRGRRHQRDQEDRGARSGIGTSHGEGTRKRPTNDET